MVYGKDRRSAPRKRPSPTARSASKEAELDEIFFALSHPARRRLLTRLGEHGDQAVGPLAGPLRQSPAQITKHLAILERAGLITRQIAGREHRLHLQASALLPATDWIERHRAFWSASLDTLEHYLDSAAPDNS
jgi:DNA-binding transcriptional ArsR family regulator